MEVSLPLPEKWRRLVVHKFPFIFFLLANPGACGFSRAWISIKHCFQTNAPQYVPQYRDCLESNVRKFRNSNV